MPKARFIMVIKRVFIMSFGAGFGDTRKIFLFLKDPLQKVFLFLKKRHKKYHWIILYRADQLSISQIENIRDLVDPNSNHVKKKQKKTINHHKALPFKRK